MKKQEQEQLLRVAAIEILAILPVERDEALAVIEYLKAMVMSAAIPATLTLAA